MKIAILVDLENVKTMDFDKIPSDALVFIFTGENQNKIDFKMVVQAQKLGDRVTWIKIKGNGKNAADFHMAFILGKYSAENPNLKFILLSKDKGFDPLMNYLIDNKIDCQRIDGENQLANKNGSNPKKMDLKQKVKIRLEKLVVLRRPKTKKALFGFIKAGDIAIKDEGMVNKIFDYLCISGMLREENNKIEYLDNI